MLPLLLKLFGQKELLAIALKVFYNLYHNNRESLVQQVIDALPNEVKDNVTNDEVHNIFSSFDNLIESDAMKEFMVQLKRVLD